MLHSQMLHVDDAHAMTRVCGGAGQGTFRGSGTPDMATCDPPARGPSLLRRDARRPKLRMRNADCGQALATHACRVPCNAYIDHTNIPLRYKISYTHYTKNR